MTSRDSPAGSALRKHSVTIAGHRTSLSLEDAFWRRLQAIAAGRGISVGALIEQIDRARAERGEPAGNLSSAVRVFVLEASVRDR
jgi:predicted DNA-binding ribbon-helix-helix protein